MSGESKGTSLAVMGSPLGTWDSSVAPAPIPAEAVTALVSIASSLESISTFLGGQTLPNVLKSYSIMQCIGQVLNGLTANGGREGLDARTIDQDATDATHRILKAFSHLEESIEARRNGEHSGEVLDAQAEFEKWKGSQPKE